MKILVLLCIFFRLEVIKYDYLNPAIGKFIGDARQQGRRRIKKYFKPLITKQIR